MKYLPIFCLFIFSSLSAGQFIGRIEEVKGVAYLIHADSPQKHLVKKGLPLLISSKLVTENKASILIKLSNGILRYIPENSVFSFQKKKLKLLRQTESQLNQLLATLGTKADNNDPWIEEKEAWQKDFLQALSSKQFVKSSQLLEKAPKKIESPELLYLAALASLKIGDEKRALIYLQKMLQQPHDLYREEILKALTLCYLRSGAKRKAQESFRLLKNEFKESNFSFPDNDE